MKSKPEGTTHIDVSLKKVFQFCHAYPAFKYVSEHFVKPMEQGIDPQGICLDFVSYAQTMDEANLSYFHSWYKVNEVLMLVPPHSHHH